MQTSEELKELAKQRGIKYFSRMSKKKLCEVMGISLVKKPTKITFKNTATGGTLEFPSIYRASKELNVNRGLITYYTDRKIKIGDETYLISRL
jgi:nicotinamide mononucleotide (NMN) deamidase PncC